MSLRIGIDLGGTKIEGILMDHHNQIIYQKRIPTPKQSDYQTLLQTLTVFLKHLEAQTPEPCFIGIGAPGSISVRTGRMKNCNITVVNDKPFKEDLQKNLNKPIRLANDANCFTLSETIDGAAAGYNVVFGVIIGTGTGGGIAVHKQVHQGPNYLAGEWGHVTLQTTGGQPCYCGNLGCIETFLSGPGMLRDYQSIGGNKARHAEEIVELYQKKGDPLAQEAVSRYLHHFGRALAMVVNILDPDAIVLGGGLSNMDFLYEQGPIHVAQYVFGNDALTPIVKNKHGDASGVRGAAMLWPVNGHGLL